MTMKLNWLAALAVGVAMAVTPEAQAESNGGEEERNGSLEVLEHELFEGETLGSVAMDYEVNVLELKEWNDLDCIHEVEPGDEVEVHVEMEEDSSGPEPVVHRVQQGDTFSEIAEHHGVSGAQLRQWNPNIDPRRLQLGDRLMLHVPASGGDPVSWGRANSGRLYNGRQMESSPGMYVRNKSRAYGTDRTVDMLQAAGADVQGHWPDAPDLVVGSLSRRNGGPLSPHRSHQSGRDADVTYYHRGNVALPDFLNMTPEMLDAVKTWHLFKVLIDTGTVEFIFVDYALQEVLYEYAMSIGYEADELAEIFQYPRGRSQPVGIIRHANGHRNHFHIRFTCSESDQNCR